MVEVYDFAKDREEADQRAKRFKDCDPFPSVERALLSSAEIYDYVRVTAMLDPFDPNKLKPASYEALAGGEFTIWNTNGLRETSKIDRNKPIRLPANSIAFVQTEVDFRLPNYIALRFNLRISHVHRGLLLGTGPLVDPGFQGKLLIPLHNLTNEDYLVNTDRGLIWIEFTKTTHNCESLDVEPQKAGKFREFPVDKCWLEPYHYFQKANNGNPIRSSIPDVIEDSNKAANAAIEAKSYLNTIGWAAAVAVSVALVGIVVATVNVVETSKTLSQSISESIGELKAENRVLKSEVDGLRNLLKSPKGQDF
jgi:deoxycytidine triphosphate deaminase